MSCNCLQYADDTVLFISGNNLQNISDLLQRDLNTLVAWCDENQLTINAKKTKSMLYTYQQNVKLSPLSVKGVELEEVDKYKYLEIIMDNNMSFKSQLSKTICSVNQKIWLLRYFRGHNYG